MKQVLLRVTRVRAEMRGGKLSHVRDADLPARKVKFAEGLHDPDIHWKRALKSIREQ